MDDSQPFAMQSRLSNASPVRVQDLIHNQSGCNLGYPMLRPQRLEVQDLIHNHSGCNLGYPMLRPRVQDLIHNQSGSNHGYPMLRPSGFRTRFTTIRDPIPAIQCFARPGSGSDSQPFGVQSRLSNASPVRVQDLIHNQSGSNFGYPTLRPYGFRI